MKFAIALTLLSIAYPATAQSSSSKASSASASAAASSASTAVAATSAASAASATSAAAVATTTVASSGFTVSTTASGASLSIIQPLTASIFQVGQQLSITWSLTGAADVNFNKANITFEIADGTNPNNVVTAPNGALTFAKPPIVGDLVAVTTIPNIPSGKAYTVKAIFKDTTKFIFWYSPSFQIVGGAVSPTAAGGGAAAQSTQAQTVKTTSASRSGGISTTQFLLALVPAILLAF
ncbi:UNVERIFIED_CONTAM: hypothetical protein HDU68_006371 [Siphonaria sp. JEL0065]|nr:hypothetical protein HDU68_006371 [Siphonaria sp. JEL0065]